LQACNKFTVQERFLSSQSEGENQALALEGGSALWKSSRTGKTQSRPSN